MVVSQPIIPLLQINQSELLAMNPGEVCITNEFPLLGVTYNTIFNNCPVAKSLCVLCPIIISPFSVEFPQAMNALHRSVFLLNTSYKLSNEFQAIKKSNDISIAP